jgi:hypothetical protein
MGVKRNSYLKGIVYHNCLKRALRKLCRPKKFEASEKSMTLLAGNKAFLGLYRSPSIVKIVKFRRLRWAGHVARMVIQGIHTEFWYGDLLGNVHMEN